MAHAPDLIVRVRTEDGLATVIDYIEKQFDRLDRFAHESRKAAIDVACIVAAGGDDDRRDKLVSAALAAGLYTSPAATLADDLKRVITEVQHG
jgi:hypothetical protein